MARVRGWLRAGYFYVRQHVSWNRPHLSSARAGGRFPGWPLQIVTPIGMGSVRARQTVLETNRKRIGQSYKIELVNIFKSLMIS